MELRAHELVRLHGALSVPAGTPAWVAAALARTPWAVVRRARAATGAFPAGVRGLRRSERHALEIPREFVEAVVTPEMLAERWSAHAFEPDAMPALRALAGIDAAARAFDLRWGPGGSVGFELATGVAAVHAQSDCDIVVRAGGVSSSVLAAFAARLRALPVRVDAMLEFAFGGAALDEYLATARPLVKTADGPRTLRADERA